MLFEILLSIYVAGIVVGLAVMRDPWLVRIGTAAVWPLGILSFAVVTVILLTSAVYLWPIPALAAIALLTALWLAF